MVKVWAFSKSKIRLKVTPYLGFMGQSSVAFAQKTISHKKCRSNFSNTPRHKCFSYTPKTNLFFLTEHPPLSTLEVVVSDFHAHVTHHRCSKLFENQLENLPNRREVLFHLLFHAVSGFISQQTVEAHDSLLNTYIKYKFLDWFACRDIWCTV